MLFLAVWVNQSHLLYLFQEAHIFIPSRWKGRTTLLCFQSTLTVMVTRLVKIYVSIIRPVLEYACPVWSTSLPKYLSDAIEMIQKRVLRSIHPGLHYDDILVLIGLQSLKMRRDNICKAYFNWLKCNTRRLNHLIPERRDVHYSLRNANVYPIPVTRADRYKNSIVPWGLQLAIGVSECIIIIMWTLYGLEQYLLTVVVVLFYACIVCVLCIWQSNLQGCQ